MATNSKDHPDILAEGEIQARNDDEITEFISTLPTKEWVGIELLHQYNGFWFPTGILRALITQNKVEPKENDILLATMPKSGTVWLKALSFAILNRKNHPINQNQNQNHPLLSQNPHSLVPFIHIPLDLWSPPASLQLYATHMPRPMLPADAKCKIVYLCRNLKDVFVSYWHFFKKIGKPDTDISMEECFESFCEGISAYGPVWDHILGYWKESMEKPDKVLFLRYEEMKEDPVFQVKRMAAFVGCPITAEEEEQGLADDILRLCSFDHLSNLDINKNGKWWAGNHKDIFRKGEVGDWKNHLTNEMAERVDQITEQKLQGSGLKL